MTYIQTTRNASQDVVQVACFAVPLVSRGGGWGTQVPYVDAQAAASSFLSMEMFSTAWRNGVR